MTDHPDIVERLTNWADDDREGPLSHHKRIQFEAVAEITRLRAEAEALRKALVLVMDYPDVRKYLGSQVANVADAAIAATKEQQA